MRRCNHPTCNTLIPFNQRYCDKHKTYTHKKYKDERQRNNPQYIRFYESVGWKKLREIARMKGDYLCCKCGRTSAVVDHIIPIRDDWDKRLDLDNLQLLCNECHNRKTYLENKKRATT